VHSKWESFIATLKDCKIQTIQNICMFSLRNQAFKYTNICDMLNVAAEHRFPGFLVSSGGKKGEYDPRSTSSASSVSFKNGRPRRLAKKLTQK
jgi:hypothetical protein